MSVAEEIKAKIDIVDLIASEVQLRRSGSTFKAPCPFHAENTPSFVVNPERQSWHCFGACSEGGDIFSWEMKRHGVDFKEALQRLAQRAGVQLRARSEAQARADEQRQRLLRANEAALHFWRSNLEDPTIGRDAQAYLHERGISTEAAQRFNLGLAGSESNALAQHLSARGHRSEDAEAAGLILNTENGVRDRFHNRLIFPIRNARGETVGFGGRTLIGEPAKYINTPESELFRKRDLLYGFDLARPAIREAKSVIIVEGYTDVISAHEHGSPNTVASMGTALTEAQVGLFKPLATEGVWLAFDPDAAGQAAARRGIDTIQNQLDDDIRIIPLPDGCDPDELIRTDPDLWTDLVKQAPTYLDWLLAQVQSQHAMDTPRGRAKFVDELESTVRAIKHPVLHEHYLGEIARLAGIDPDALRVRYRPTAGRQTRLPDQSRTIAVPMQRKTMKLQSFVLQHVLRFEAVRQQFDFGTMDFIEDGEDRAILSARLSSPDRDWADELTDSSTRIAELSRDAERLPPYSDPEAVAAVGQAVARIRKNRTKEGLRLKNLEIRERGGDEIVRAAALLDKNELCDPDLTEDASMLVGARDESRSLHQRARLGSG